MLYETQTQSLSGASRKTLRDALNTVGVSEKQQSMRLKQLWKWQYTKGATSFSEMSDIAQDLRTALSDYFSLNRPDLASEQISTDGTRKWLLKLKGETPNRHHLIETVYIPEIERGTLCVSSQVGCTLTCTFCHTGTQKMVRNLTAQEIVGQVLFALDKLYDWPNQKRPESIIAPSGEHALTNIVFMGMGEPLFNTDNVIEALQILTDNEGLDFSRRKVTVSTSGVVPDIKRLGEETGAMLAISLHAVNNTLRDEIVPINRKYPLEMLLEACREYPGLSNARRITFEYVMLKDVNDSEEDAEKLVRLLEGIPSKINLIPFNPWPGTRYTCSSNNQIHRFADILSAGGYSSPIRRPRGQDILAACGQLKSETERIKKSARSEHVTAPIA